MNKVLYSLLIALTCTTNIVPLTIKSTLLENPKTGKRVLLLGDAHDQYIEGMIQYAGESELDQKAVAQANLSVLATTKRKQQKALTTFTHAMLADGNKQSTQTVVISEFFPRDLRNFCNNNSDNTLISETFCVMPKVFMNTLLGSEPNAQERCAIFEKSIKPFGITTENSFAFNNRTSAK